MSKMLLLVKLSILLTLVGACNGYIRVCYFTNWAQYSQFKTSMIDPFLCTHILYAFGKLVGTQIQDIEWNDETIQAEVMAMKNTNPNLKVLLAIGGWTADNSQYVNLVASQTNMATFSTNAISYLRQRGFDGLDLDWEYPGNTERGSSSVDRARFTQWIQILQNSFIAEAQQTGKARLLLTAATGAAMPQANTYYEVSKIGNYLDFVNIMTYDFHGQWDGPSLGAQHHSALYPEVNSSVIGWINAGFPANKLTLGMGAYGRGYKLSAQPNGNGVGAQPNGYDMQKYSKICSKINTGHEVVQLTNQQAVAAIGQTNGQWEWIGFDNADTFQSKARYIIANNLAGSMVWSLDQDDATNACGGGKYPLLSVLKNMLPGSGTNDINAVNAFTNSGNNGGNNNAVANNNVANNNGGKNNANTNNNGGNNNAKTNNNGGNNNANTNNNGGNNNANVNNNGGNNNAVAKNAVDNNKGGNNNGNTNNNGGNNNAVAYNVVAYNNGGNNNGNVNNNGGNNNAVANNAVANNNGGNNNANANNNGGNNNAVANNAVAKNNGGNNNAVANIAVANNNGGNNNANNNGGNNANGNNGWNNGQWGGNNGNWDNGQWNGNWNGANNNNFWAPWWVNWNGGWGANNGEDPED